MVAEAEDDDGDRDDVGEHEQHRREHAALDERQVDHPLHHHVLAQLGPRDAALCHAQVEGEGARPLSSLLLLVILALNLEERLRAAL